MLKNTKKVSLLLILLFVLFSCETDNSTDVVVSDEPEVSASMEGVGWVLSHGYLYSEVLDFELNVVNEHFGGNTYQSTTDLSFTSYIDMDYITLNNTKWYFNESFFILNDGEPKRHEKFDNGLTEGYRIVGLGGGTSRVVEVMSVTDENLVVRFNEGFTSIDVNDPNSGVEGVNVEYWSILTFTKEGSICDNCWDEPLFGYDYAGVFLNNGIIGVNDGPLVGTKWRVDRYSSFGGGTFYPDDIIEFTSNEFYLTNGGTARRYTLSNVPGNNNKSLSLYGFTTLGGDYTGEVISTFVEDGEINNASFYDMFDVNKRVSLWMTRIE